MEMEMTGSFGPIQLKLVGENFIAASQLMGLWFDKEPGR
jgi:hypothetical protein